MLSNYFFSDQQGKSPLPDSVASSGVVFCYFQFIDNAGNHPLSSIENL
jgi:hypothetical protein